MTIRERIASMGLGLLILGCSPPETTTDNNLERNPQSLDQAIETYLREHPEVLFSLIEDNPEAFMTAAQNAADARRSITQQKSLDDAFANPKSPQITDERIIFGNPDAVITIVEYSDFQCPYCAIVIPTLGRLMDQYGVALRLVYKHLPLENHDQARTAASYFEAIGLQDADKARAFHDALFDNQKLLSENGEAFLAQTASELGVDIDRLQQDLQSELILARIDADIVEAGEFGFQGTPGFLINGVPLVGAKPASVFQAIINRHLDGDTATTPRNADNQ